MIGPGKIAKDSGERSAALAFAARVPFLVVGSVLVLFVWPFMTPFLYLVYTPHYLLFVLAREPDVNSDVAIAMTRLGAVLFCLLALNWLILIVCMSASGTELLLFPPFRDHPTLAQKVFWCLTSLVPSVLFLTLLILRTVPRTRRAGRWELD